MPSTTINPQEVVEKIQIIFKELHEGVDVGKLTAEDKEDILLDLDNLEELVLSIKKKISDKE